jgi:hypothetical protein
MVKEANLYDQITRHKITNWATENIRICRYHITVENNENIGLHHKITEDEFFYDIEKSNVQDDGCVTVHLIEQ